MTSRKKSEILDLYFVSIGCKYSSYYFLTFATYTDGVIMYKKD